MAAMRTRSAVAPLRRHFDGDRLRLPSVQEVIAKQQPSEPVHCLRPAILTEGAARFVSAFPGDVLYAVKCNPEPAVLRALHGGGVRHFDVASPGELRLVRQMFPEAEVHYMHPVKSRAAIREAYFQYGCRDFVLDSFGELIKLLEETDNAEDLGLIVRLALPKGNAVYDLSGKFGAPHDQAVLMLQAARTVAVRLGVSFHVGSQCLDPTAYERALELAGRVIAEAGVKIEVVDVGGGFPVSYPDVTPPPLDDFMAAIARGFAKLNLPETRLWCEPGRALVAPGASLVVQVVMRRDNMLYINDGVYGSLSDAGAPGFRFPCRLLRPQGSDAPLQPFALFGPTCDSADRMNGPFLLPADIREGDWFELGQLGAYGGCLRTAFNGFDRAHLVEVRDLPLLATPGFDYRMAAAG